MRERLSSKSKSYGRIDPRRCFPTIMTLPETRDSRSGMILHWDEDRTISLLEARRAQSFLDHEVLVGQPNECWKIVGNSVARTMSLALGLSLRDAWLKNSKKYSPHSTAIKISATSHAVSMEMVPRPQIAPLLHGRQRMAKLRKTVLSSAAETSNSLAPKRAPKNSNSSLETSRTSSKQVTSSSETSLSGAEEERSRGRSTIARSVQNISQNSLPRGKAQQSVIPDKQETSEDEINDAILREFMDKVNVMQTSSSKKNSMKRQRSPMGPSPLQLLEKRQKIGSGPNGFTSRKSSTHSSATLQSNSPQRQSHSKGRMIQTQKTGTHGTPSHSQPQLKSKPKLRRDGKSSSTQQPAVIDLTSDSEEYSDDELGSCRLPMTEAEIRKAKFKAKLDRKGIGLASHTKSIPPRHSLNGSRNDKPVPGDAFDRV